MSKKLLITFGCSWTFGVGVGYQPGMSQAQYDALAWDHAICDRLSFRGILTQLTNSANKNFSRGGSSNQRQFYEAKKYFGGSEFANDQKMYQEIVVLHGITSTSRNFLWSSIDEQFIDIKYNEKNPLSLTMAKYAYDHNIEVQSLATEMQFWNQFYQAHGVRNFWFDTFNHHSYRTKVPNLLGADSVPRDLMSWLCQSHGKTISYDTYHQSMWQMDCARAEYLTQAGWLNPYTFHPTAQAHQRLADFFYQQIYF